MSLTKEGLQKVTNLNLTALTNSLVSIGSQMKALQAYLDEINTGKVSAATEEEETEEVEEEEEEAPKKSAKTKKAAVEEEEEETEEEETEETEEEVAPGKGDVIRALKAASAATDRKSAIKTMKKFGVESVHDLPKKHYAAVIAACKKLG